MRHMGLRRKMVVLVGNGAKGCKRVHLSPSCGETSWIGNEFRNEADYGLLRFEVVAEYLVFKELVAGGAKKLRPLPIGQVLRVFGRRKAYFRAIL